MTANISLLLIKEAQEELDKEQKKNKHQYKINKNVALGILLKKMPLILLKPESMQIELKKIRPKLKKK